MTTSGSALSYTAVDPSGKRLRGQEAAATAAALTQTLEARGLLVLTVTPAADGDGAASGGLRWGGRREVLEATRAIAVLLTAGLP